jgi:hypothetical protein
MHMVIRRPRQTERVLPGRHSRSPLVSIAAVNHTMRLISLVVGFGYQPSWDFWSKSFEAKSHNLSRRDHHPRQISTSPAGRFLE